MPHYPLRPWTKLTAPVVAIQIVRTGIEALRGQQRPMAALRWQDGRRLMRMRLR